MRSGQSRRAPLACVALLLVLSDIVASQGPGSEGVLVDRTSEYIARTETLSGETLPDIAIRLLSHPAAAHHQDRIVSISKDALRLFGDWLGAYPASQLTIVDTGWPARHVEPADGVTVVVASRWLSPGRDMGLERAVVAAIARAYFVSPVDGGARSNSFGAALADYCAARAINQLLEGRHVLTQRFFGGFVPYSTRSVSLSRSARDPRPIVRTHAELESADATVRNAEALHTLERFIGWPTMQQALAELVKRTDTTAPTPSELLTIIGRQQGGGIDWWTGADAQEIDVGIAALTTEPSNDGEFTTHVQVRRFTDRRDATAPLLAVVTRFADGTRLEERWDAAADDAGFTYVSTTRAVSAVVDPDNVFLLDANRLNNTRTLESRASGVGWQLTVNWMTWLQHLTLTYLALV